MADTQEEGPKEESRERGRHWSQEEDRVPPWWSLGLMAGTLVIIFISIAWSWWLARGVTGSLPEAAAIRMETLRSRSTRMPLVVGRVRQTLIERERAGEKLNRRKRAELERYEWVDRRRGIVRIPIERAMDLVIAEQHRTKPGSKEERR